MPVTLGKAPHKRAKLELGAVLTLTALLLLLPERPVQAQVRFEVRGESGVAQEPITAGLNQVVRPTIYIVNPAGGGVASIQGFQMAIRHEPDFLGYQSATWEGTALQSSSLRNNLGPEFFQAREATTAGVTGITLGVVFELQRADFILGAGEWRVAALAYRAARVTAEGTPTRLDFAPELGTPPVANAYNDRLTGETRPPAATAGLAVNIGAELAYAIAFREPKVVVDPGGEITVPILIQNSPRPVHGFSFGVKHDPARMEVLDVSLSADLRAFIGGPADERFLAIQTTPQGGGGFTVAMVLSATDRTKFLDPQRSPHHVIDARYRPRLVSGSTSLQISGDVGQPKVEVILDLSGIAQRPQPPATNPPPTTFTVEIRGTGAETRFIRGDLDQNGRISITDPIGLLNFLFLSADRVPAVFRPTIQDCLVAFNVDGSADPSGLETETRIDITDGIHLLNYLVLEGPPPAAPFDTGRRCSPFTGQTNERLRCRQFTCPPE